MVLEWWASYFWQLIHWIWKTNREYHSAERTEINWNHVWFGVKNLTLWTSDVLRAPSPTKFHPARQVALSWPSTPSGPRQLCIQKKGMQLNPRRMLHEHPWTSMNYGNVINVRNGRSIFKTSRGLWWLFLGPKYWKIWKQPISAKAAKIGQDMSRCYCTSLWSERNACRSPRSAGLPGAKAAKVYFMLPVTSLQYHQ